MHQYYDQVLACPQDCICTSSSSPRLWKPCLMSETPGGLCLQLGGVVVLYLHRGRVPHNDGRAHRGRPGCGIALLLYGSHLRFWAARWHDGKVCMTATYHSMATQLQIALMPACAFQQHCSMIARFPISCSKFWCASTLVYEQILYEVQKNILQHPG